MNEYWVLAFVITPVIVMTVGYLAVRLHEWDLDRRQARRDQA